MNYRVFVKKKEAFQVESASLFHELKQNLNLAGLQGVQMYNVYDVFHGDKHDMELLKEKVLSEKTDEVFDEIDLKEKPSLHMNACQDSMISVRTAHSSV